MRNTDEIVNVSFDRNYPSSNFLQTIKHMETKSFLVQIMLSAMNKSQFLSEVRFPNNQILQWDENLT